MIKFFILLAIAKKKAGQYVRLSELRFLSPLSLLGLLSELRSSLFGSVTKDHKLLSCVLLELFLLDRGHEFLFGSQLEQAFT